jgi:tetratricopeptide (TPR) repeat protein
MVAYTSSTRRRFEPLRLRRAAGGARFAVCLAVALGAQSVSPAAQKDAFRDALVGFHARLAGDYGDEGALVTDNLARMSSSLAKWDESILGAEREVLPRLPAAAPAERIRMHLGLAQLYVDRGRYADAVKALDAAIGIDGTRGAIHVLRGFVLEMMGRPADGIAAFRRAWEINRDDPVSAYLVADRVGDSATAQTATLLRAHSRHLGSVPPDRHAPLFPELALVMDRAAVTPVFSPALYAEGFALVASGRYSDAIATFRESASRDPLATDRRMWPERLPLGISRLRDGDLEAAISHLESAVLAAPASSETHRILAGAYGETGNDAKSIEHLETAVRLAPNDERSRLALGRALTHAGQPERAEQVLLDTLDRLPASADAHSALADLHESRGRGLNAAQELERAASFTVLAGKGALYWRLADLLHRHLEYERVIEPLTRRARLSPNDAGVHRDLGLAYTRVGRTDRATIELVIASLLGPADAETLAAIGQIHLDTGNYAAAETVLRRSIALAPGLTQARYALGRALARLGRANESREQLAEFDKLRAAANERVRRTFEIDMLRQEAARETDNGRHEGAATIWQKVVDQEPERPEHRIALAAALAKAGRPEAAAGQLETAAKFGANPEVYRMLAELYQVLGRTSESVTARQTYERLLQEQRRAR